MAVARPNHQLHHFGEEAPIMTTPNHTSLDDHVGRGRIEGHDTRIQKGDQAPQELQVRDEAASKIQVHFPATK